MPDDIAERLDDKLLSISEDMIETLRQTGVEWKVDRLTLRGDLRTVRGQGGLLGLARVRTALATEAEEIVLTARLEPTHAAQVAEAEAMRGDVTEAETREVQEMILRLARERLELRDWQYLNGTSKLPDVETEWDSKWAYWLGKVLEALGHPPRGRRTLTRETLGWLRRAEAEAAADA